MISENAPPLTPMPTPVGLVDLLAPNPATIDVRAMVEMMGRINRWNGATEIPIPLAQHSVGCYEIFRDAFPARRHQAVYALLHDAHEYLIGDIIAPTEALLERLHPGFRAHLTTLKSRLDTAIRQALGVPEPVLGGTRAPDIDLLAAVHDADLLTAHLEWELRMPAVNGRSPFRHHAAKFPKIRRPGLKAMSWVEASDEMWAVLTRELREKRWERA